MKTDGYQGETFALGQLLQSSISWQNFFILLLKTDFPVLQEGREVDLVVIFSGTGYSSASAA